MSGNVDRNVGYVTRNGFKRNNIALKIITMSAILRADDFKKKICYGNILKVFFNCVQSLVKRCPKRSNVVL